MSEHEPGFVAVDWGTTRMRASLVGADGAVIDRREAETGVQSVPPGGFPAALEGVAGPWLSARPDLPVLMAGMVGRRHALLRRNHKRRNRLSRPHRGPRINFWLRAVK